jgi:hypothetical protein
MATLEQYPIGNPRFCPYNDCDSSSIEIVGGVSECASTHPVDSNKVTLEYLCKKCNRRFLFKYNFEVCDYVPIAQLDSAADF